MATIVTRAGKGSPLTNQELDNNFSSLNTDKAELSGATFTGVVTANAGVVVDNITIDANEIDVSSGNLTLDVAGDIILDADGSTITMSDAGSAKYVFNMGTNQEIDISGSLNLDVSGDFTVNADGGDILYSDASVNFGKFTNDSQNFVIQAGTANKDIIFKGTDDSTVITALTLDMSAAGAATFNSHVIAGGGLYALNGDGTYVKGLTIAKSGEQQHYIYSNGATQTNAIGSSAANWVWKQEGGANKMTLSAAGAATFSSTVNGMTIKASASGDRFGCIPEVASNGVMEIGRYIDFHATDGDTSDYGARLDFDGTSLIIAANTVNTGTATFAGGVSLGGNLTFTAADGMEILAKESLGVTIDSDDNQGSRSFQVRSGASGSYESLMILSETTGAIFNENGLAALDFRVESDADTHALFVNGGTGTVNVGSAYGGTAKFTVSQSSSAISCYLTNTLSTINNSTPSIVYIQTPNDAAIQDGFKMVTFADSDTVLGSISTASNSSNVSYNTSSDERLKENIVDMPSQLEAILKVQPRQFDWKKHGNTANGFIAQELYETYPEAVTVGLEDETQDPWSVDYGRLTPFIIKAIQEQQTLIETLTARITALENASLEE